MPGSTDPDWQLCAMRARPLWPGIETSTWSRSVWPTAGSRAFFYLAIPFRDHSLPEAFRFTEIRPLLAGEPDRRHQHATLELENRCTGNRTVGSNPTLSRAFCLPIAMPREVIF